MVLQSPTMNVIQLPPLSRSQTSLIMGVSGGGRNAKTEQRDMLLTRVSTHKANMSNFDSSGSSTSKSQSSGGLLVNRSKPNNNLGVDNRLGTVFEQKSTTTSLRRLTRTVSNQRLSNRSDYGSITTGTFSINALSHRSPQLQRCVSTSDISKLDKNNNTNKGKNLAKRHNLVKHCSEQRLDESGTNLEPNKSVPGRKLSPRDAERTQGANENSDVANADGGDDDRDDRILAWLRGVEEFAEPPPQVPIEDLEDAPPPQTDTAIHIVYKGEA